MFRRNAYGLTGLVFSVMVGGVVFTVSGDAGAQDSPRVASENSERPVVQVAMTLSEPVEGDAFAAPVSELLYSPIDSSDLVAADLSETNDSRLGGAACCSYFGLCTFRPNGCLWGETAAPCPCPPPV